jgi:sulfatase maturation enzyme AslB (radical SAM superfamily)
VKLASQRNVLCVVTTNGLKLKDKAEELVRAKLPILQVSLDGWDEPSQAARGHVRGSFERLCDGVRAVREARGSRPFPVIRILTAITRVNHAHLDRIQCVIAALGVPYWGISNYFYLNRNAHERHQAFALINGLSGSIVAHAIPDEVYLTSEQVRALKFSLQRVQELNRRHCAWVSHMHGVLILRHTIPRARRPGVWCATCLTPAWIFIPTAIWPSASAASGLGKSSAIRLPMFGAAEL